MFNNISNIYLLLHALTSTNPGRVETQLLAGIKDIDIPRPFHPLPNVSQMKVISNVLDPLLARSGYIKKLDPLLESQPLNRRLKASNRYLRIMQNRLANLLVQGRLHDFWILAVYLLAESKVLRLCALRSVLPNWQRDVPWIVVVKLLTALDQKIMSFDTGLTIKRKYVSKVKADGTKTWRPIGAPIFVDRMFLYLLQGFMVMCTAHYIGPRQFAYIPGRGVSKCWAEIRKYLKWDSVYEFDLKGAFPSVSVRYCYDTMLKLSFPKEIALFIAEQSIGNVDIRAKVERLPEKKIDIQEPFTLDWNDGEDQLGVEPKGMKILIQQESSDFVQHFEPDEPRQSQLIHMLSPGDYTSEELAEIEALTNKFKENHPEFLVKVVEPEYLSLGDAEMSFVDSAWNTPTNPVDKLIVEDKPLWDPTQPVPLHRPMEHSVRVETLNDHAAHLRGFPQGSGLSPILFNLVFASAVERGHFAARFAGAILIAYADDFLLFSKKYLGGPISYLCSRTETMAKAGLEFSIEKSRILKRKGEWLVPGFKFLGNTLDIATGQISGPPALLPPPLETKPQPNPGYVLADFVPDDVDFNPDALAPADFDPREGSEISLAMPEGKTLEAFVKEDGIDDTQVPAYPPRGKQEATLSIRGTPKSGAINEPMPPEVHAAFQARDKALWSLITSKWTKEAFSYKHPQEVLNAWGRGEAPASLIPLGVIEGQSQLNKSMLQKLGAAAHNLRGHDINPQIFDVASVGLAKRMLTLAAKGQFDTLSWLSSRLAGFQQSLLYAPEESSTKALHGRKVFAPKFRLGRSRSFVQIVAQSAPNLARHFSIYNSTSLSNLYLLQMQKGATTRNVRKGIRGPGYPVGYTGKRNPKR